MKREFLMLAHPYKFHQIAGWYMSEKLDGIRCFWDGGLSRDIPTISVPWANTTDPKTGKIKSKIKPMATGLWSRYGNPIMAPEWFLNSLPCIPLDGELWAGRGEFQTVSSIVRKDTPQDAEWRKIQYAVFGCPNIWSVFQDGEIKNAQFVKTINLAEIKRWLSNRHRDILENFQCLSGTPFFMAEIAHLNDWIDVVSNTHFMVLQTKLPLDEQQAIDVVMAEKDRIISLGGEGVFLHNPKAPWVPKRTHDCLKVKGASDAEGTIVGFISGRETEKGSKLLGMIGALVLDYDGKRLELSGLTDEERQFTTWKEVEWAKTHPGEQMPSNTESRWFRIGDKVTFTYRELTNDGVPKEARYQRKRND